MTLSEIKALVVSADPKIRHYFSMDDSEAYSYWEETRRLPFVGDDRHDPADQSWKFYVHRYTKIEGDPVAATIFETLDEDPRIAVHWEIAFDNESGYIHHIFECEGF